MLQSAAHFRYATDFIRSLPRTVSSVAKTQWMCEAALRARLINLSTNMVSLFPFRSVFVFGFCLFVCFVQSHSKDVRHSHLQGKLYFQNRKHENLKMGKKNKQTKNKGRELLQKKNGTVCWHRGKELNKVWRWPFLLPQPSFKHLQEKLYP